MSIKHYLKTCRDAAKYVNLVDAIYLTWVLMVKVSADWPQNMKFCTRKLSLCISVLLNIRACQLCTKKNLPANNCHLKVELLVIPLVLPKIRM